MKKFLIFFAFLGLFSVTFSKLNAHDDLKFSKFRRQIGNLGTVINYNEGKNFGFIRPDKGGDDLFFYFSVIKTSGLRIPQEGDRVKFDLSSAGKITKIYDI